MTIRIVFMGSPEFALPTLAALAANYSLEGVVTQPDRPAGRGNILTSPPIKVLAESLGLPYIQPKRLKEEFAVNQLQAWKPDLVVVAAFGQILRQNILDLAPLGCLNVHASLLPRWRGAAPIQTAILHGDNYTGVSIMKMDPGIDTGPLLSQRIIEIDHQDTGHTLSIKLAQAGAELLLETLPQYLSGALLPIAQDDTMATYAPMLSKEDGLLKFDHSVAALSNRIRAFNPWPGAFTHWKGQILKVHHAKPVMQTGLIPGTRLVYSGLPAIAARDGLLLLEEVQLSGRKQVTGKQFLQGAQDWMTASQ